MKKNCGCGTPTNNRSMLLVEATASEATLCGNNLSPSASVDECDLQEDTYDVCLSGFLVPLSSGSTNLTVCNASVYTIKQWLQFVSPLTTLMISAISGNTLTLINRCPNSEAVMSNPDAGQSIESGTKFYVVGQPDCKSDEESLDEINEALEVAEELCVPNLDETSPTAIIQIIGRTESDPGDSGFKKCLRRAYGFIMKAGTPVFGAISSASLSGYNGYRRLGISKTTREVKELPNFGEFNGVQDNNQYSSAFTSTKEYVVGPSHIPCMFLSSVKTIGAPLSDPPTFHTLNDDSYVSIIDLTNNDKLEALIRQNNDYYVMLHLVVCHSPTSTDVKVRVSANTTVLGWLSANNEGAGMPSFSIVYPVKILKDVNELRISLQGDMIGIAIQATLVGAFV